ncbi:hypothetical protein B0H11DRAFT_2083661 [Mycena galericulata]|nr:hypothetical protein B0H11DRAFT_2083661 [Mycena galericulata]
MEYDDEEDESDADGRGVIANADAKGKARAPRDEGLQLSKSVAQEKLRVLAEKSAILSRAKNGGGGGDSVEAERRRLYVEAGVAPWAAAGADAAAGPSTSTGYATHAPPPPPNRSLSSAPVGFPYNLPAPAPPSTPRTTRQQMLRNEMSESLRHNLLWQRKLSRTDFIGPPPRRTKSTVNVMSTTEGRQPERSLVRVTPRAPGTAPPEGAPPPMVDPPGAPKKKLVRNLSWANNSEYHTSGW